jgi:hypothetical protein
LALAVGTQFGAYEVKAMIAGLASPNHPHIAAICPVEKSDMHAS